MRQAPSDRLGELCDVVGGADQRPLCLHCLKATQQELSKSSCSGCRRSSGKRGADAQGLGRSRGGLSTKIHAAGDALGNPVRLIGSPGQRNDIAFAHELIEGFAPDVTIADKGYDADHLCDKIAESGAQPVIPPKRNRTFKRPYDAELYKERNIIERFFNKLKQFRRVATRYDKLLANFMGFVKLARLLRDIFMEVGAKSASARASLKKEGLREGGFRPEASCGALKGGTTPADAVARSIVGFPELPLGASEHARVLIGT